MEKWTTILPKIKKIHQNDDNKTTLFVDLVDEEVETSLSSDVDESIDRSQDLLVRCPIRRKKYRLQDDNRKKPRFEDSSTLTESRDSSNLKSPKERKRSSYSARDQRESRSDESSSLRTASINEDSGVDSNNVNVINVREDRNASDNNDGDSRAELNLILPVLKGLKDSSIAVRYTATMRWQDTREKTAVDTIVRHADATDGNGEIAERCKKQAIDTIEIAYELILESLKNEFGNETMCANWFAILLTFCDSSSICEETINFLMSKLSRLQSTEDVEEPEIIIQNSTELNRALFVLYTLIETLRKYSTNRGKNSRKIENRRRCQLNREQLYAHSRIFDRHTRWLEILSTYVAENLNSFPLLAEMAQTAVDLLTSIKSYNV